MSVSGSSGSSTSASGRRFFIYVVTVAAAVLTVAGVIHFGSAWLSPPGVESAAPVRHSSSVLAQFLDQSRSPLARLILQLVVILFAARALGTVAGRLGQPAVIGEIAAGVVLGPSLMGWIAPGFSAFLFPEASLPFLQLLSQIGVLLFMFLVGLALEPSRLRGRAQTAIAVSHFSILIPFVLGVTLSLALYRQYAPPAVPFFAFALFCGVAMSITAFPVLARILEERGLTHTPLGTTAITAAAVDDVTAWSILAFVVALSTAGGAVAALFAIVTLSVSFALLMVFVGRPILERVLDVDRMGGDLSKGRVAVVLGALLTGALITEIIGIHALFGAFVAGAVMPRGDAFRTALRDRIEPITSVLLLPIFFAYTGLRTQIGLLDEVTHWAVCLAIVVVATAGKLGGTVIAARWTGIPWTESLALGALMNTRGLMELVALNVGYNLGILTPEIFTMMVLMALVTTALTGPFLTIILRSAPVRDAGASAK